MRDSELMRAFSTRVFSNRLLTRAAKDRDRERTIERSSRNAPDRKRNAERNMSREEVVEMRIARISFAGRRAVFIPSSAAGSDPPTDPNNVCILEHYDMTAPVYRSQGTRQGEANLSQPTISNFDLIMRVMYGITGANYDSDTVSDICA